MGESANPRATLRFDRRIRLEFHAPFMCILHLYRHSRFPPGSAILYLRTSPVPVPLPP